MGPTNMPRSEGVFSSAEEIFAGQGLFKEICPGQRTFSPPGNCWSQGPRIEAIVGPTKTYPDLHGWQLLGLLGLLAPPVQAYPGEREGGGAASKNPKIGTNNR